MQDITKAKATFNLSKSVLESLDDCWIKIRKMRGDKKVTKTDIVEAAILDALEEFRAIKQESKFYVKLENHI